MTTHPALQILLEEHWRSCRSPKCPTKTSPTEAKQKYARSGKEKSSPHTNRNPGGVLFIPPSFLHSQVLKRTRVPGRGGGRGQVGALRPPHFLRGLSQSARPRKAAKAGGPQRSGPDGPRAAGWPFSGRPPVTPRPHLCGTRAHSCRALTLTLSTRSFPRMSLQPRRLTKPFPTLPRDRRHGHQRSSGPVGNSR